MKVISQTLLNALLILLAGVLTGCIDRLDFFGDTVEGQLVIYGLLSDADNVQRVQITRTNSMGFAPTGENGATVTLLTQDGRRLRYQELGNGVYELGGFRGSPGESYSLEVLVENELYESTPQIMPGNHAIDSLDLRFGRESFQSEVEEAVLIVTAHSKMPAGNAPLYLRWTATETYQWERTWLPCIGICPPPPDHCFISDLMDPNRVNMFDGGSSTTRHASQEIAKRRVDNSFIGIFYVSLKQHSITKEAFEYWRKINLIINNRGSLFDTPPAPIFGNFTKRSNPNEGVLGFFEVAKVTYTRKFTSPGDAPFNLTRPCVIVVGKPASEYADECVHCEARANGRHWTYFPPDWWFRD